MDTSAAAAYRFEGFTLDLARGLLLAVDGTEIALRPKTLPCCGTSSGTRGGWSTATS